MGFVVQKVAFLRLGLAAALLFIVGCDLGLSDEDPGTSPAEVFDVFWEDMDQRYALFEHKRTNWDSLRTVYRPQAINASEGQLAEVLCALIFNLLDGHVTIDSGNRICSGTDLVVLPPNDLNFNFVEGQLQSEFKFAGDGQLRYGQFSDSNLGYIHIRSFSGGASPIADWTDDIDDILRTMQQVDGLIVDVRNNAGGNGFNGVALAGRFVTERRPFLTSKTRNGPAHDDFTNPTTRYVEPRGSETFNKPVIVLTNRYTFSAGEWFVLAMSQADNVRTMGDFTRGGLSSRIFRGLPNGWSYSLSIQINTTPEGDIFEGFGMRPDSLVSPNVARIPPRDVILSAAKNILLEAN